MPCADSSLWACAAGSGESPACVTTATAANAMKLERMMMGSRLMSSVRRRGRGRHTLEVDVRFVDCRSREEYDAGHIPGAAFADSERDLTGSDGGGRHPLPAADSFAAWASRAGIGRETLVVAYDDGNGWAARLWWLLRHLGHDHAAVLHVDPWRGPFQAGEEQIEPAVFTPRPRADDITTADELLERGGDPKFVLVDA